MSDKIDFLKNDCPRLLKTLSGKEQGKWGVMNAQQMVEHLSDSLRNANNKKHSEMLTPLEQVPAFKKFMLSDKEFRPGTKNPAFPEIPPPVKNPTMEAAISELEMELADFFTYFQQHPQAIILNPIFGELNYEENLYLLHKHAKHHLKQFGLIRSPLRIIVTGATGMAGSEVVRAAIADDEIGEITAIVRKPLKIEHPKLKVLIHQNFLDFSALTDVFKNNDACLWCLGISQTQVSKEKYHEITYDYAVTAAKAMLEANPNMSFVFLSGMGADSSEKSRTIFARVKGMTENALLRMGFKTIYIARPGGIQPVRKKDNVPFFEKFMMPFFPVFKFLMPTMFITSAELAKALLNITKNGSDQTILENKKLQEYIA